MLLRRVHHMIEDGNLFTPRASFSKGAAVAECRLRIDFPTRQSDGRTLNHNIRWHSYREMTLVRLRHCHAKKSHRAVKEY